MIIERKVFDTYYECFVFAKEQGIRDMKIMQTDDLDIQSYRGFIKGSNGEIRDCILTLCQKGDIGPITCILREDHYKGL